MLSSDVLDLFTLLPLLLYYLITYYQLLTISSLEGERERMNLISISLRQEMVLTYFTVKTWQEKPLI